MKRFVLIIAAMALLIATALPASAKKPSSNLSGPMDIVFAPIHPPICDSDVFWYGTVELHDVTYGMTFAAAGLSKFVGNTQHYWEDFAIFDGVPAGEPEDWTECPDDGNSVLEGDLKGVGRFSNGKITENGTVTDASFPFGEWDGRRMHADGVVEELAPGVPSGFTGTIRFN